MKKILVTGSGGLIGSEAARFFGKKGYHVIGIDNNLREYFFGKEASTSWNNKNLRKELGSGFEAYSADIRDAAKMEKIFAKHSFDIVVHTAAQPSHDWAAKEPLTDFSINALGTIILLEQVRKSCPKATFIFTSTNKVYGDTPNLLPFVELEDRYEVKPGNKYRKGIDERMSIDQSTHSVFGASKVAADIMTQEYGRYFGMNTGVFRGGCLTGPNHSGAQLHGFLAYLAKCIATGTTYTIFGYKGKQVRDNIHSSDLVNMFWHFHQKPRSGEVYNAGGGRESNISMKEAIKKFEKAFQKKAKIKYIKQARTGDHQWYISDLSKFKAQYPAWSIVYGIDAIIEDIATHGHFS